MRAPRLGTRALVHALVLVATAATLYPVLLVLKKAIEPGQEFAWTLRYQYYSLPAR